jgi:alkylation response protein AidB-like acyl-CoA dehydrogenase
VSSLLSLPAQRTKRPYADTRIFRLAKMIAYCESSQAYLENITYQMQNFAPSEQRYLGGPIGLLKMFATRAAHEIADEAVSIFGGRALTKSGMGRVIEMFHRTYKFDAILGGAEEILGKSPKRSNFFELKVDNGQEILVSERLQRSSLRLCCRCRSP